MYVYILICAETEGQEFNRITGILEQEGMLWGPCPYLCSKQGQLCVRSPEVFPSPGWSSAVLSPCPCTVCSSLMIVLVASTGLTPVYHCLPYMDAVVQTWSNECWVKGHNHFAPSTGSVPVTQPNMLPLAFDRSIRIVLHPVLTFVWVI